jgi:hypothetical protein
MNTNMLIGLVALIVVVGGGAWFLSSKSVDAPTDGGSDTQEVSNGSGSFGEMIARAGSWTCTVSTSVEAAPSEGTTYISNGMIRADFVARPEALGGQEVSTHMIQSEGYIYTWSDMAPQGMKMLIPKDQPDSAGGDAVGTVGADAQVEYSCMPWVADSSKFAPPSTVTFMELGANGMPQMPTY